MERQKENCQGEGLGRHGAGTRHDPQGCQRFTFQGHEPGVNALRLRCGFMIVTASATLAIACFERATLLVGAVLTCFRGTIIPTGGRRRTRKHGIGRRGDVISLRPGKSFLGREATAALPTLDGGETTARMILTGVGSVIPVLLGRDGKGNPQNRDQISP